MLLLTTIHRIPTLSANTGFTILKLIASNNEQTFTNFVKSFLGPFSFYAFWIKIVSVAIMSISLENNTIVSLPLALRRKTAWWLMNPKNGYPISARIFIALFQSIIFLLMSLLARAVAESAFWQQDYSNLFKLTLRIPNSSLQLSFFTPLWSFRNAQPMCHIHFSLCLALSKTAQCSRRHTVPFFATTWTADLGFISHFAETAAFRSSIYPNTYSLLCVSPQSPPLTPFHCSVISSEVTFYYTTNWTSRNGCLQLFQLTLHVLTGSNTTLAAKSLSLCHRTA